jgi:IS1 family transposase
MMYQVTILWNSMRYVILLKKKNKRWLWTAISRKIRKIVAYYIGDRSEKSCKEL